MRLPEFLLAARRARGAANAFALAFALVASLLLAACASVPPGEGAGPLRESLDAYALEARFALRFDQKNYSGRLSWRHQGASDELLLASPFGQGLAEITSDAGGARLTTSDGRSYVAADVEALTLQFLGYPLPLKRLVDWVRARGGGRIEARDALARPLRLHHEDWRITYGYNGDNEADRDALPTLIFAERADGSELRLRIDSWTSLPTAP